MKSLLETIHTKFPEDSAWNVLWVLSYQCGIEEVQKALNEIKVLFHESGLTQRAADFACTCREASEFEMKTNPACPVHGEAAQSR